MARGSHSDRLNAPNERLGALACSHHRRSGEVVLHGEGCCGGPPEDTELGEADPEFVLARIGLAVAVAIGADSSACDLDDVLANASIPDRHLGGRVLAAELRDYGAVGRTTSPVILRNRSRCGPELSVCRESPSQ